MCDNKEVKLTEKNVIRAYNSADDKGKKLIADMLGEQSKILSRKITDKVIDFVDICEISGTSLAEFNMKWGNLPKDEYAYKQIKLFVEVLNEGWVPNYGDSNEYKWYPYFKWNSNTAGFGFSRTHYGYDCTAAACGVRLVFKSKELAEFAGRIFEKIYNNFYS